MNEPNEQLAHLLQRDSFAIYLLSQPAAGVLIRVEGDSIFSEYLERATGQEWRVGTLVLGNSADETYLCPSWVKMFLGVAWRVGMKRRGKIIPVGQERKTPVWIEQSFAVACLAVENTNFRRASRQAMVFGIQMQIAMVQWVHAMIRMLGRPPTNPELWTMLRNTAARLPTQLAN